MERLRQLKEGLGQIKQGLINLDRKYAERAERDMGGVHKAPLKVMLGGNPILKPNMQFKNKAERDAENAEFGYGPTTNRQHLIESGLERAAAGGVLLTNAGYRYGLPAAGVTLAGKGLFDLSYKLGDAAAESSGYRASEAIETAQYGSEADQPEENTLTLK